MVLQVNRFEQVVHDQVNRAHVHSEELTYLRESAQWMMWEHPRVVHLFRIPQIDHGLPRGIPTELQGSSVDQEMLFQTDFGRAFNLAPPTLQYEVEQPERRLKRMLVAIDKGSFTRIQDIGNIKRLVQAMRLTTKSGHPNILQLYAVRHSMTHILLTMEKAGEYTLRQRLTMQDDGTRDPLSIKKVVSIFEQASNAVFTLHNQIGLAHQNIASENFGIHEEDDSVVLKLFGFGFCCVRRERTCGGELMDTVPFLAPETFNGSGVFCAHLADVWRLGVVFLEVKCGMEAISSFFGVDMSKASVRHDLKEKKKVDASGTKAAANAALCRLHEIMSPPGAISKFLSQSCRTDLRNLLPASSPVLTAMLHLAPERRWSSEHVATAVETLAQLQ
eukprot:TRINITY_DN23515_c0_g2_i1.p1 TRINITY_DN23515_c0_g2~~TRINITY_DN23515_c0_g2_i1.p1  ORF type:complete len:450 (-),score=53.81 TRINITY_DN23515_c0_g2_i1:26-1192(-)